MTLTEQTITVNLSDLMAIIWADDYAPDGYDAARSRLEAEIEAALGDEFAGAEKWGFETEDTDETN